MKELFELVDRFQKLKEVTGTNKSSSYTVSIHFDLWEDKVTLEWGCYDVGSYPRHYQTECTREDLLTHMVQEIEQMEQVVKETAAEGGYDQ